MKALFRAAFGVSLFAVLSTLPAAAETLTIATVNNGDMIRMQNLSPAFTEETGIELNWVVLEENTLRQNVTTDIATNGLFFDRYHRPSSSHRSLSGMQAGTT